MSAASSGPTVPARAGGALRDNGYLAIRDYGAIGDGRTAALIGRDGAIDWLCLPDLDSASVFGALLDNEGGGRFELSPARPFSAEHRYVPDSNVLETTFSTAEGVVRVTDAMSLPRAGLAPQRELLRRIEGLAGEVEMRWRLEPRFGYGRRSARIAPRGGVPVASAGGDALGVLSWDAGEVRIGGDTLGGSFVTAPGSRALIALPSAHAEPLVFPNRREAEARLDETIAFWQRWARGRAYEGPWREAVIRSALALKLLVFAPSGAIAAAATTSLPEQLGGERNWDYRFSWVRDAAFTLDAFLGLGCPAEARAYFSWLLHASQLTHPHVRVLYRLDGRTRTPERELPLAGYAGSLPVRSGNAAGPQRQLDVYGELLQTAHRYAQTVGRLDLETGRRIAGVADCICKLWRHADTGIWEVRSEPQHFTQSKVMCWVGLDRAAALAEDGHIPDRNLKRWRREAAAIGQFIEHSCWSPRRASYVRYAGGEELDASLLFAAIMGYRPADESRIDSTIDAIREDLAAGPLVHRYRGEDGLSGSEGAFIACSFWLAEALAHRRRPREAAALMDELVGMANDLGLYAEEIDAGSGAFLGNFPQALVHLALINAAVAYREAEER